MTGFEKYKNFYTRVGEKVFYYDLQIEQLLTATISETYTRVDTGVVWEVDLIIHDHPRYPGEDYIVNGCHTDTHEFELARVMMLNLKYEKHVLEGMCFEDLLHNGMMVGDDCYQLGIGESKHWEVRFRQLNSNFKIVPAKVNFIISRKGFKIKTLNPGSSHLYTHDQTVYKIETGMTKASRLYGFMLDLVVFRKLKDKEIAWLKDIEQKIVIDMARPFSLSTMTSDDTKACRVMENRMNFVAEYLNSERFLIEGYLIPIEDIMMIGEMR